MNLSFDLLDIKIMKMLYGVRTVGYTRVARILAQRLNHDTRSIIRKIDKLINLCKEYKLCFSIDFQIYKLGLKFVAYFFEDDIDVKSVIKYKLLRSKFNLVPKGCGAIYLVPVEEPVMKPSDADVYIFYDRMLSTPDIDLYGLKPLFYIDNTIAEDIFNLFNKEVSKLLNMKVKSYNNVNEIYEPKLPKARYDWIDLTIIKELEKNPFAKINDLVKSIGISSKYIRRHLKHHVLPIVKGMGLRLRPVSKYFSDTLYCTILRFPDEYTLDQTIHVFKKFPLITSIIVNPFERIAMFPFSLLFPYSRSAYKIIHKLETELGIEILNSYYIDIGSLMWFTIPYEKFKEYNPYDRSWVYIKSLREILRRFGRS